MGEVYRDNDFESVITSSKSEEEKPSFYLGTYADPEFPLRVTSHIFLQSASQRSV